MTFKSKTSTKPGSAIDAGGGSNPVIPSVPSLATGCDNENGHSLGILGKSVVWERVAIKISSRVGQGDFQSWSRGWLEVPNRRWRLMG